MDTQNIHLPKNRKKTRKLLSKREEEVAALLKEGYSFEEISKTLNLTTHTVRLYKQKISLKIGTPNLVLIAKFYQEYKKQNTTSQSFFNSLQKLKEKEIETLQKAFTEGLSYQQHLDNYRYKLLSEAFIAYNHNVL